MNKKIIWIVVLVVILVGGWYLTTRDAGVPAAGETMKLGGAFGLTGVCAETGEGELNATRLAIEEQNNLGGINDQAIELVVEDTGCDNAKTVNAVTKLISTDKVVAILGPTWGDSFQAAFPILRRYKVVAISASTAMEALEAQDEPVDFMFSTWFPQNAEIDTLQRYAIAHSVGNFVVIHDQDPFGLLMADLFNQRASANGVKVLRVFRTAVGTDDYRTVIAQMKSEKPQAIFASFLGPEAKVKFLRQARELGVQSTLFSSADIQNYSLLESFSDVLDGVIYTYAKISGAHEEFVEKYRARYGEEPEGQAVANAYDAAKLLVEVLKSGVRDGENIQGELMNIKMPGTVVTELSFTDKHQINGGEFEVKTIKNGQFVRLEE